MAALGRSMGAPPTRSASLACRLGQGRIAACGLSTSSPIRTCTLTPMALQSTKHAAAGLAGYMAEGSRQQMALEC